MGYNKIITYIPRDIGNYFIQLEKKMKLGGIMLLLNASFYPLVQTISCFLAIEDKYIFFVMSILPPLAMWAGMMSKQLPTSPQAEKSAEA